MPPLDRGEKAESFIEGIQKSSPPFEKRGREGFLRMPFQKAKLIPSIFTKIMTYKGRGARGNPSVTGGYSLWTKVRRKGKGPPWPEGSVPPRRDWNHEALVSSWMGRGPRPPASPCGGSVLSQSLCPSRPMLPARTARTPRPQQDLLRATRD